MLPESLLEAVRRFEIFPRRSQMLSESLPYSALTHNRAKFAEFLSQEPGIAWKFCLQIWTFQEGLYKASLFRFLRFF